MKKFKMLLYSAAFVLALSASFAFKPAPATYLTAYFKSGTTFCSDIASCNGGTSACVVSTVPAYNDQGVCTIPAGMH